MLLVPLSIPALNSCCFLAQLVRVLLDPLNWPALNSCCFIAQFVRVLLDPLSIPALNSCCFIAQLVRVLLDPLNWPAHNSCGFIGKLITVLLRSCEGDKFSYYSNLNISKLLFCNYIRWVPITYVAYLTLTIVQNLVGFNRLKKLNHDRHSSSYLKITLNIPAKSKSSKTHKIEQKSTEDKSKKCKLNRILKKL